MFEKVEAAPSDPILGITEAFKKDERADKINLSVGVYKDANGETPVLGSVKEAERRLLRPKRTSRSTEIPFTAPVFAPFYSGKGTHSSTTAKQRPATRLAERAPCASLRTSSRAN